MEKGEKGLIDESKFPFKIDHSKCLNCQVVDRLDKDNPNPSNDWQRGVHLCTTCQWHCAMLALDVRRDGRISSELRALELDFNLIPSVSDIYFDTVTPKQGLQQLESVIRDPEISIEPKDREIINEAIKTLKQIVGELGYNKLRVVC